MFICDISGFLGNETTGYGAISTDTTWTVAGSSYLVSGDVHVKNSPATTLTIESKVGVGFGFETGIGGWINRSGHHAEAIGTISQSSEQSHTGLYSLKMMTNLIPCSKTEGCVLIMYPGNMEGQTITAWLYCPKGARGDPNHPNGIQIFVKDNDWKSEYGAWQNITEDKWFQVSLVQSTTVPLWGYMDPGFDPTKIIIVGIKIGLGSGSEYNYNGPIYLDDVQFTISPFQRPPSDYLFDFENLTFDEQNNKPFEKRPYFDIDPAWGADAWGSKSITIKEIGDGKVLAISSTFTLTNIRCLR